MKIERSAQAFQAVFKAANMTRVPNNRLKLILAQENLGHTMMQNI